MPVRKPNHLICNFVCVNCINKGCDEDSNKEKLTKTG